MIPLAIDWNNLHQVLRSVYEQMTPLCADMATVAKGLAGLGALFYIAHRVWQSLARSEPIDIYPLLRPFAIGLCIMFFPTIVLGSLDAVLNPVAKAASSLVDMQSGTLRNLQQEKDRAERMEILQNPDKAYLVGYDAFDERINQLDWDNMQQRAVIVKMHSERAVFGLGQQIKRWFRDILETIFHAASLSVDTLRTFFMIVLAIFGPISFALSVFDGFQNSLPFWLSRYIMVWLWLPVADMLGAILTRLQIMMLQQDISSFQNPFASSDGVFTVQCIFFIIGLIGYFCVPTISSWIIQAGGMGAYGRQVNKMVLRGGRAAAAVAGSSSGNVGGRMLK